MKRLVILTAAVAICLSTVLGAITAPQPVAAQSGNVWQVAYFANVNWAGNPVFTTTANAINFNWGSNTSPAPFVPSQNWSARFNSTAFFYSGIYLFNIQADDDFALWIDGVLYADTRGAQVPGRSFSLNIPLQQGNHNVQVDYRQYTGPAYLFLNWSFFKNGNVSPPSPPAPPNPPAPPAPPSGSLVTDFGDYTRCMQQQIHQSNCFVSNGAWNAPNLGSIQMEPQILLWERCTPDTVKNKRLYPNRDKVSAACSRTQAGWFPR